MNAHPFPTLHPSVDGGNATTDPTPRSRPDRRRMRVLIRHAWVRGTVEPEALDAIPVTVAGVIDAPPADERRAA